MQEDQVVTTVMVQVVTEGGVQVAQVQRVALHHTTLLLLELAHLMEGTAANLPVAMEAHQMGGTAVHLRGGMVAVLEPLLTPMVHLMVVTITGGGLEGQMLGTIVLHRVGTIVRHLEKECLDHLDRTIGVAILASNRDILHTKPSGASDICYQNDLKRWDTEGGEGLMWWKLLVVIECMAGGSVLASKTTRAADADRVHSSIQVHAWLLKGVGVDVGAACQLLHREVGVSEERGGATCME